MKVLREGTGKECFHKSYFPENHELLRSSFFDSHSGLFLLCAQAENQPLLL